jgi:hypothetical protein
LCRICETAGELAHDQRLCARNRMTITASDTMVFFPKAPNRKANHDTRQTENRIRSGQERSNLV